MLGLLGSLLVHLLFLILVILAPVYVPEPPPPDHSEVLHVLLLPKPAPPATGGSGGGALPRRAGPPREGRKAGHAPHRSMASFRPAPQKTRPVSPGSQPPVPVTPARPRPHPQPVSHATAKRAHAPLPVVKARLPLAPSTPLHRAPVNLPAVMIAPPRVAASRPPRAEGTQAMPPPAPALPKLDMPAVPQPAVSLDAQGVSTAAHAPVQAVTVATVTVSALTPPLAPSSTPDQGELPSIPSAKTVSPAPKLAAAAIRLPQVAPTAPVAPVPDVQVVKVESALPPLPTPAPTPAPELAPIAAVTPALPHLPAPAAPSVIVPAAPVIATVTPVPTPVPTPAPEPAPTTPAKVSDKIGDGPVDQLSSGRLTMRPGRDDAHGGHLGGPGSGAHLFNKDGSVDLPAAVNGPGKTETAGASHSADGHDTSGLNGKADRRQSGSLGSYIERRPVDDENVMGRRSAHMDYKPTRFEKNWTPLNESSIDTLARHTAEKVQPVREALLPNGVRLSCQGGAAAANPDLAKRSGLSLLSLGCREAKPATASRKDGDRRLDMAPARHLAQPSLAHTPPPAAQLSNSAICATARVAGSPTPPGCPPPPKPYVPAPASSGSWAPPLGQ